MINVLDKVLSKIPFNGFKAAIGWALTQGADFVPDPKVQLILRATGSLLVAIGFLHDGVKDRVGGPQ